MTLNRAPGSIRELSNANATLHIAGSGSTESLYVLNSDGTITNSLSSTQVGTFELSKDKVIITLNSNATVNSMTFGYA